MNTATIFKRHTQEGRVVISSANLPDGRRLSANSKLSVIEGRFDPQELSIGVSGPHGVQSFFLMAEQAIAMAGEVLALTGADPAAVAPGTGWYGMGGATVFKRFGKGDSTIGLADLGDGRSLGIEVSPPVIDGRLVPQEMAVKVGSLQGMLTIFLTAEQGRALAGEMLAVAGAVPGAVPGAGGLQ